MNEKPKRKKELFQEMVTDFLGNADLLTMEILDQGPYSGKRLEYDKLKEALSGYDDPALQRLLDLQLELREAERNAAYITGMNAMYRLLQTVTGEDKEALQEYMNYDITSE